jgi:predicted permease
LPLGVGLALRLLVAPMLTWLAVWLIGIPHPVAELLVVISSAPVGVLLAVMSTEYCASSELALAVVFLSTVLSPLTVTMVMYLLRTSGGW